MTEALLMVMKFGLLLLLYLFLARTLRAVVVDLYGPRRTTPSAARPAAAKPAPSPRKPRKTPREIVVHPTDGPPRTHGLGGRGVTMGRSPGVDVVVDDVYVSDEHAQILPQDGGWAVRDLGSTNGTYLNGAKVTRPTSLADGDQIRLGKTRIEVRR